MTAEPIKIATTCTRCGTGVVLKQDPECPAITVEKWLRIIVCNRCGEYLESYRRFDDAIAFICGKWFAARGGKSESEARAHLHDKLVTLTKGFSHLIAKRWNTVPDWDDQIVEVLLEKPEQCHKVLRYEEKRHKEAHEAHVKAKQEKAKQYLSQTNED